MTGVKEYGAFVNKMREWNKRKGLWAELEGKRH